MKKLQKLNRDKVYQINLKLHNGSYEYVLCDVNDSDETYILFDDKEVQ